MLNLKVPKVPKITLSTNFFKSKSFMLLLVSAILIGISVYIFRKYIANKINPEYVDNTEFKETSNRHEGEKEATLYLFYVNWCMYCKKAMPEWEKFKAEYNEKTINGYKLILKEYECSDENNDETNNLMDKYNIEGFPTIILVQDDEYVTFEAKPTYDTLEEFVKTL